MIGIMVLRNLYDVIATTAAVNGSIVTTWHNNETVYLNRRNCSLLGIRKYKYYKFARGLLSAGLGNVSNEMEINNAIAEISKNAKAR